MDISKNKEKIGVLGPEGTFSHQAAKKLIGMDSGQACLAGRQARMTNNSEIIFYKTIHDVFEAVEKGECDKGVVPIENSLGGSVGFTLDALLEYDLTIELEEIVPIVHCLLGVKGTKKSGVKYLYAHTQAYSQCEKYIRENLPNAEVLETTSNGESARLVRERRKGPSLAAQHGHTKDGPLQYAAIAPEITAEIYGLEILQKSIQDSKHNATKFVVISKAETKPSGYDRTSVTVYPQIDRPGILYEILGYFKDANLNLSKVESRPSKGKLGDYIFYIDFHGHINEKPVQKVIRELEKIAFVKILGSYGRRY